MKRLTVFVSVLLLFLYFGQLTFAQEDTATQTAVQSAIATPTPVDTDYDLPYPGLLPDSPLYSLKVL